eukprot:3500634-Rhodomonas_salina.4
MGRGRRERKKIERGGGAKRDEQEQDTIKAKNVTTKRRREEEATDRDANEAENVPGETIFEEIGRNDGDEGPDRADPVQDQSSLDYELPQRVVVPVRQTPSQSDRVERWRCFAMCQGLSGAWTEGPKEQPAILRALQRRGLCCAIKSLVPYLRRLRNEGGGSGSEVDLGKGEKQEHSRGGAWLWGGSWGRD